MMFCISGIEKFDLEEKLFNRKDKSIAFTIGISFSLIVIYVFYGVRIIC